MACARLRAVVPRCEVCLCAHVQQQRTREQSTNKITQQRASATTQQHPQDTSLHRQSESRTARAARSRDRVGDSRDLVGIVPPHPLVDVALEVGQSEIPLALLRSICESFWAVEIKPIPIFPWCYVLLLSTAFDSTDRIVHHHCRRPFPDCQIHLF